MVHKLQSWFADVAHVPLRPQILHCARLHLQPYGLEFPLSSLAEEQIQRQMESTSSAELVKGCLQVRGWGGGTAVHTESHSSEIVDGDGTSL